MKILLSEEWHSHIFAEPFFQRFRELGVDSHAFQEAPYFGGDAYFRGDGRKGSTASYFRGDGRKGGFGGDGRRRSTARMGSLLGRVQRRLGFGPAFQRLNADLLRTVERLRPEVVFLFRGDAILPETLQGLRSLGAQVVGWNNDDPFSEHAHARRWRHFVNGIPGYDRLWGYRMSNVEEFRRRGCPRVGLLRSFYLRELNFPVSDPIADSLRSQVAFLGHWEDDGREDFIEALLREPGLDFKLWGTLWERSRLARELAKRFGRIRPVYREDYNLAINGAGIGLVFLSRLNHDTYTRRCFEIPITGTLMLSEYTPDLASLFEEGVEAEFFRGPGELLDKVRFYVRNDEARRRVGLAGRARVLRDGHEALDRAKQVLVAMQADLAEARRDI